MKVSCIENLSESVVVVKLASGNEVSLNPKAKVDEVDVVNLEEIREKVRIVYRLFENV